MSIMPRCADRPLLLPQGLSYWLFAALFLLAATSEAAATIVSQASSAVVRVIVAPDDQTQMSSIGSGFKVAPGLYVTNRHVVEKAIDGRYHIWIIPSAAGAKPIEGQLRATSQADLALIAGDDIDAPALSFDPDIPESGQSVMALGYPQQMDEVLGRSELEKPSQPDVSVGAIINSGDSSTNGGSTTTKLVHSAAIWPGNSGGPLIDFCGRVVGVNTWLHASGGLAQQNIATSSQDVVQFLNDNDVTPTMDQRPCGSGAVQPPLPSAPGPASPDFNAQSSNVDDTLGAVILVIVIALGLAFAGYMLHRHLQAEKAQKIHDEDMRGGDQW